MKYYKYNIQDLNNSEYSKYYLLMSKDKQCRVDRFRFEDDKKRTVVGEMLARRAISKWCGVPEESIVFETSAHGKPYAKNLNIEFSISHSANIVVCVIDVNPVGIDIEKIRSVDLNMAKQIFSDKEIQYIFGCTLDINDYNNRLNDVVLQRFFELWTKKEARGKCIGTGLFTESKEAVNFKSFTEDGYCISIAERI